MRKYIFASVLFLLSCVAYGQTQLEMNMQAKAEYLKADEELKMFCPSIWGGKTSLMMRL